MQTKPILVNLIGGLGNQMFQWACGRAVACDTGLPLIAVTDQFDAYRLRSFELSEVFSVELLRASPAEVRAMLGSWRSAVAVRRLLEKAGSATLLGNRFLTDGQLKSQEELRRRSGAGAYLHGYWQSEGWFAHRAAEVRADFTWRSPMSARSAEVARQIGLDPCSLSIHVRRGDYVKHGKNQAVYATCPPEYYESAVTRLRAVGGPGRVFAFSDDPAWVAQVLAPRLGDVVIVDHNSGTTSHEDMRLMSLCRHHVIANSSFSWWAAWLDPRMDKQVIAPKNWFADGRSSSALVPDSWVRM